MIAVLVAAGLVAGFLAATIAQAAPGSGRVPHATGQQHAKTYYTAGSNGIYPEKLLLKVIGDLYVDIHGPKGLRKLVANGAPAGYTFQPHTITTRAKCYIAIKPTARFNNAQWVNNKLYFARWSRKGTVIKPCATGVVHSVRDPAHTKKLTLAQTCPRSLPAARLKVCRAMAFRPVVVTEGKAEVSKLAAALGTKLGAYGAVHKLRFDEGGFSSRTGPYMHRVTLFFNRSSTTGVPLLKELVVTVAKHHRLAVTPYFY